MFLGRVGNSVGCVHLARQEWLHLWVQGHSAGAGTIFHHTGRRSIIKNCMAYQPMEIASTHEMFSQGSYIQWIELEWGEFLYGERKERTRDVRTHDVPTAFRPPESRDGFSGAAAIHAFSLF